MKRILGTAFGALIAFAGLPAFAADWGGFYTGLELGARTSDVDFTTQSVTVGGAAIPLGPSRDEFRASGFRIGIDGGYNYIFAPGWLVGGEGDFGWADNSVTKNGFLPGLSPGFLAVGAGDTLKFKNTWDGSLRGRLGYEFMPQWMVYGTIGLQAQHVEGTGTCVVGAPPGGGCFPPVGPVVVKTSDTQVGWTIGGGVESFLTDHWLVRGEYRYADLGTVDHTSSIAAFGGSVGQTRFDLTSHIFKVALVYKFK